LRQRGETAAIHLPFNGSDIKARAGNYVEIVAKTAVAKRRDGKTSNLANGP
jgi:hypothetical protein